jgi:hypothetical protein
MKISKRAVIYSILAVLTAGALVYISPIFKSTAHPWHISAIRQLGVELFSYANNNGGVYPASVEEISDRFSENSQVHDLINDPSFEYYYPEDGTSSDPDLPLLSVDLKDYKVIYYIGNSAEWIRK